MYNKLFAKIVRSSIWLEPTPTRLVWFMFIALMDEDGFVQFASVANVAHTARITEPEAEEAIKILEAPDSNSADPDHDGKRIERAPGGWMILNSAKYRNLVTRDMIREQTRERVARHRAKVKGVKHVPSKTILKGTQWDESNADVTQRNESVTISDTDTRVQSRRKKTESANGSRQLSDLDWLASLTQDKTYSGIDVPREHGKMIHWCRVHQKQPTRRRFVNWLNRAERPMSGSNPTKSDYKRNYLPPANEPTEIELAAQRKIVREASEKLKEQLNR